MILGYTGMPPFQIPPTIPPLPERLPSHDRRTETNARPHPHRHAQNRRCPSWYVQQHSWRELGVLHISIHFHEIHLVCCFFYDYTDAPTKTEKSFVTTFFRTFLRVYLTGDYYNTVSAFLWTSAMFDSLVKLSACIETVWILKRHRFWCNSLASQLASSKLEIKPTRKSLKSS